MDPTRDEIDELIDSCLKEKLLTLVNIVQVLENRFSCKLGDHDYGYVEAKYIETLEEFWLNEVSEQVTNIFDPRQSLALIDLINSLTTFQDCYKLLGCSQNYNGLITDLSYKSEFLKSQESICIAKLKHKCISNISNQANCVKDEISFFKHFVNVIKSSTNLDNLYEALLLNSFIQDETSFKEVLFNLQRGHFSCPKLRRLKHSANKILNKEEFFFVDHLKELAFLFLKPLEIKETKVDGRLLLEVSGKHLIISKVLQEIEKNVGLPLIEEVRFVNFGVLHVNEELKVESWHGKNIVVVGETLIVSEDKFVTWDFSGKDADLTSSGDAGTSEGGSGLTGANGSPGESGGNVCIMVESIENSMNLKIVSNGGKGSMGQNGGKGKDGENGKYIDKYNFQKDFPPVSHFINKEKNLKITLENVSKNLLTVDKFYYGFDELNLSKASFNEFLVNYNSLKSMYFEVTTIEGCKLKFSFFNENFSFCQSFLLYNGSLGMEGSDGGAGGVGGKGGFAGEVIIQVAQDSKISIEKVANNGPDGEKGKAGKAGLTGVSGLDRGYMDKTLTLIQEVLYSEKWPKVFMLGEEDGSRLNVKFYVEDNYKRVKSPHNNLYAEITRVKRAYQTEQVFQCKVNTVENQQHTTQAKRKKGFDTKSLVEQFAQKDSLFNIHKLEESLQKTSHDLKEMMKKISKQSEKLTKHFKVTRQMSYLFDDRLYSKETLVPALNIDDVKEGYVKDEESTKLLQVLTENPKLVSNWTRITNLRLNIQELNYIWEMTNVFNVVDQNNCKWHQVINTICVKYHLATLEHIDELLKDLNIEETNSKLYRADCRFLSEYKKGTRSENQGIVKQVETFFYEDTLPLRQELVRKCNEYSADENPLSNTLDTFICEFVDDHGKTDETISEVYTSFVELNTAKGLKLKEKLLPVKTELLSVKKKEILNHFIKGTIEQNVESKLKFENEITKDIFLGYLYKKFSEENRKKYNWGSVSTISSYHIEKITKLLHNSMVEKGPFSASFREFIAQHFDVNILLYKINANSDIELVDNHNPRASSSTQILLKDDKFLKLNYDYAFAKLVDQKYIKLGSLCNKIMFDLHSFSTKEEFNEYVSKRLFLSSSYKGILSNSSVILVKTEQIMSQETNINMILNSFGCEEDKDLLQQRLEKLKSEFVGYNNILHYMALHFLTESNSLTGKELCFIVNLVLKFYLKESQVMPLVSWIIASQPHSIWLIELGLLMLELYFKEMLSFEVKTKWRQYLSNQNEKDRLMLFLQKLVCENCLVSIDTVNEILDLMSNIPQAHIGLQNYDLKEWKYYLKDRFWAHQIKSVTSLSEDQIKTSSYYLSILENSRGLVSCKKLISALKQHASELTSDTSKKLLLLTLKSLVAKEVFLTDSLWEKFHKTTLYNWQNIIDEECMSTGVERSVEQLVRLIQNCGNTSSNILNSLLDLKVLVELINVIVNSKKLNFDEMKLKELFTSILNSNEATNRPLFEKVTLCLNNLLPDEKSFDVILKITLDTIKAGLGNWRSTNVEEPNNLNLKLSNPLSEAKELFDHGVLLPFVALAIEFRKGITLRNTQKLTVMALLRNKKNTLAQVSTGEGKSLIVVAVAIVKAICNEKVNIITSSKVLAERDAEKYKDIYELCGISVGHCCSENIDERKKVYSNCQVIYGDLANFQRDYLLDRIHDKNIIGNCSFETVIVDEVDSMLLDKGNNVLYLSHNIPGLDKLEQIFLFIWKYISKCVLLEHFEEAFNVQAIKERVMFEVFGQIKKEHIRALDIALTEKQVISTWDYLVMKEIISRNGKFLKHNVTDCLFDKVPKSCMSKVHLNYLIKKVLKREKILYIPKYLEKFVEDHLEDWIRSGINAMSMESGRDYVVDVDRSDTSYDRNPNITILDRDTGTDLVNSQWDKGLHQFLQLKHGCKLSLMSLKAVFISNVSYLKLYKTLYGLTGTLGSKRERELIKEIYDVDFVTIPTAKAKNFYEKSTISCSSSQEWTDTIFKEICKVTKTRSALVICETVNEVLAFQKVFASSYQQVHTYTRDHQILDVVNDLQPGRVLISTNLAGRGTDIKLSEQLVKAGGLHVCLTFLPRNSRIEEQAFGRAARNGEPGSARLIFKSGLQSLNNSTSKVIDIKKQRDLNELKRLADIKTHHETQVDPQEKWFMKFQKIYENLKENNLDGDIKTILLQTLLSKWAFWLDKCTKSMVETQCQNIQNVIGMFDAFALNLTKLCSEDFETWSQQIGDPAQIVKLGLVFLKKEDFVKALKLFNRVIEEEPCFSETALYYNVRAKAAKKDLKNTDLINDLKNVFIKLKERSDSLMISAFEVDELKEKNFNNLVQTDAFKTQQTNINKIYHTYIQSVCNILGYEIKPDILKIPGSIDDHIAKHLYDSLIEEEVLSKPCFKTNIEEDELQFVRDYGLSPHNITNFLKRFEGKPFDQNEFLISLKEFCKLPSKDLFWEELIENKCLINEEKYVFINVEQLNVFHPSLFKKLKPKAIDENFVSSNQIWLYHPKELGSFESGKTLLVFKECDLRAILDSVTYQLLESNSAIISNAAATVNMTGIQKITFRQFDCISKDDFKIIDIFEETTSKIIDDLVDQLVLQQNGSSYTLLIEPDKINSIELSVHKAYTDEVKSLLRVCFSFRIAFENLKVNLVENCRPNDVCLPLITNLHEKLVLNIFEKEIIVGAFVLPEKNIAGTLAKVWPKNMSTEQIQNMFFRLFGTTGIKSDALVQNLIEKEWLLPCKLSLSQNKTYFVNNNIRLLLKQNSSDIDANDNLKPQMLNFLYEKEIETVIVTLLNHLNLVESLGIIENVLFQSRGLLYQVETPSFSLHPLPSVLPDQNLTNEFDLFILNGFDQLLVLEEKKWTWKTKRNILFIVVMGISQVAVGVALGPNLFGTKVMAEGINDLQYAISCMFSGHCSLKNYFFSKAQSVATAVFFSLPKKDIFKFGFGKKVSSVSYQSVKSIIKEGSVSIATAVTQGVCYASLDIVVESNVQKVGDAITEVIYSEIDETIEKHSISSRLKELRIRFNEENASDIVSACFFKHVNLFKNIYVKNWSIMVELTKKTITQIFDRLYKKKPEKKEDLLFYAIAIAKLIPEIKGSFGQIKYHLKYLLNHVSNILDIMEEGLQNVLDLDGIKPRVVQNPRLTVTESELKSFIFSVHGVWQKEVRKVLSELIQEKLVLPVLHCTTKHIVKISSRALIKKFKSHKDEQRQAKNFYEKKKNIPTKKPKTEKRTNVDMYDECLLELLEKRRNVAVYAELMKRNVPFGTHFLELCCSILPNALASENIQLPNLEIILESSDEQKKFYTTNKKLGVPSVVVVLDGDIKANVMRNKTLVEGGIDLILTQFLQHHPQYNGLSADALRCSVACAVETYFTKEQCHLSFKSEKSACSQSTCRLNTVIEKKNPYQHSHFDGKWTFNATVDVDLRKEQNLSCSHQIEDHILKGFQLALHKINYHISQAQTHLKSFKLTLSDFSETRIEIVPQTNKSVRGNCHCYPGQYELVMPFVVDGSNGLEAFTISMNLHNLIKRVDPYCPHGPHIVYEIKPHHNHKHFKKGIKGHVLLNEECKEYSYSADDCQIAGELILPSGFELQKHCQILILGESMLKNLPEVTSLPNFAYRSYPSISDLEHRIVELTLFYKGVQYLVICPGYFLASCKKSAGEIVRDVADVTKEVQANFGNAKIVLCSLLKKKEMRIQKVSHTNKILKLLCLRKSFIYLEINGFIQREDVDEDGIHLTKRGVNQILQHVRCLS